MTTTEQSERMPDEILVTDVITCTDAWQPVGSRWSWGAYKNYHRTSYTRTAIVVALRAENEKMANVLESVLQQARIWKCEARGQKATVDAVGKELGGIPDWGPIAQTVKDICAENAALKAAVRDLAAYVKAHMVWLPKTTLKSCELMLDKHAATIEAAREG